MDSQTYGRASGARSLLTAAALALAVPQAAFAAPPRSEAQTTGAGDWAEETAGATAARLIKECLETVAMASPQKRSACSDAAIDVCLRDNMYRDSTHGMTLCASYSAQAWSARYEELRLRSKALMAAWRTPTAAEWQRAIAARFEEHEQTWQDWMKADCELWGGADVGGSRDWLAFLNCESRQTASRVLDLEHRLEWWEGR
jgi:hypothetical protein